MIHQYTIHPGPIPDDAIINEILYKGWWLWKKPYAVTYITRKYRGLCWAPIRFYHEYQADAVNREFRKIGRIPCEATTEYFKILSKRSQNPLIFGNCYMEPKK